MDIKPETNTSTVWNEVEVISTFYAWSLITDSAALQCNWKDDLC